MAALPGVLVVGLGHTGLWLARRLAGQGTPVVGTVRTEEKAIALRSEGIDARVADLMRPETLRGLCPEGGAVVHTAPPVGPDPLRDDGARAVVDAVASARPRVLVYLSSTGVYAEREGGWVDEEGVLAEGPRAGPRLDAEQVFADAAARLEAAAVVFRLAAIYGRGRGLAQRLRTGRVRLWGGGHNYLNRIHVDDIVSFVVAAVERPVAGVFNLADDEPVTLRHHALWLAERVGVAPPPEAPASEAPSPTLLGSKRVSNARAKASFGVRLAYPTYVEGFEGP